MGGGKPHPYQGLPTVEDVYKALELKLTLLLKDGIKPDSLTFAGNGEPTLHPAFDEIVDNTILLRNKFFPQSEITVLSNATKLHRQEVIETLKRIDKPVMKLDSAIDSTVELLNRPAKKTIVSKLIEQLQLIGDRSIIQTMFLQGTFLDHPVDNTTPSELDAWEKAIVTIRPQKVMIYTIARNTPVSSIFKVSGEVLETIAARVEKHGIEVQVAE